MRVLLAAERSRANVEPTAGLAVLVAATGTEARVCAPPDLWELRAGARR